MLNHERVTDEADHCDIMASSVDGGEEEDKVKTQFVVRDGTYKRMTLSEYSRPNRVAYTTNQGNTAVKVSFITLPDPDPSGYPERLCFNTGKELYVFVYKGVKKAADLTKYVDKKIYKGTNPTSHDFNRFTATVDSISLVVGFSTGPIQLFDPIKREEKDFKTFNEHTSIDKSKVTCVRWVPNSKNLFLASYASGHMYLFNQDLPCCISTPSYQLLQSGEGYAVYTLKSKSPLNPVQRWVIGHEGSSINEFAFSPCNTYLAVVSQDGFLRVFNYSTMELVGRARSYYGGFLCVCWSPDSKYVVVGGEDDLITVWRLKDRCVVARGDGHHSWVSVVAFDPYSTQLDTEEDKVMCYRLGSVGQDTQLCLWDITEDVLTQTNIFTARTKTTTSNNSTITGNGTLKCHNNTNSTTNHKDSGDHSTSATHPVTSLTQRLAGFSFGSSDKKSSHDHNHHSNSRSSPNPGLSALDSTDPMRLIGTASCPRYDQCPRIEPLIRKKIAHERLTALVFKEDCFVAACQDGNVYTWARPGKISSQNSHLVAGTGSSTVV
ncbi:WD repeat-containing protein 20 [Diaphorina citri]|uniref:WD repeat-containing protein 20 n=1 Tax=Diaphorina citri TaxID=121845 RepID=A0A3Q0J910_DIACI|nr:WD repeat-containing protein 20 [Diaphorina citri]KAI5748319.1 hypothetical protein M8J77_024277 [Diaphorina citri]